MTLASPISAALQRGATVVAANSRAARALQLQFAASQRAAGHTVWPAPAIHDWDGFLRDLYRDYAFAHPSAPMLLAPLQEQTLWTRIQRDDNLIVLSEESMAALAMDAWHLLSSYNAHASRRASWSPAQDPTDAERFRHWASAFDRICAGENWLSPAQLDPLLASADDLTLPSEICLVGFDRINPAQRDFLATLSARNVTVHEIALPPQDSQRTWIAAPDLRAEISACAAWARDLLLENPRTRIGVIAPTIDSVRGPIDRIFRGILMPASEDIRQPAAPMPWEFSLGQPLADIPAIRAALLLLRWIASPLPEEEISWLLLSGFIAGTESIPLVMARFDAGQRRAPLLTPERTLTAYDASLPPDAAFQILRASLSALQQTITANRVLDQSRPPSVWTDLVHHLLDRAAWPGQRPADSVAFQALQRWQRLLDDLALLDFDGTLYSFSDFLAALDAHARETIFAPESHDAPIQIMGPFESSGQQFDALWFLHTDDDTWPQRGRFHPLLPPAVQRQYGLPHATPEDDWNLARTVTTRLLASAPTIVFSYAQREKDADLRPSPLIASLFPPESHPQPAALPTPTPAPVVLDPIPDDATPLPWPREQNAGGADVLKRQSACPFQAFATKRLAAKPLDSVEWGLDPLEKGKILHAILQSLFTGPIRTHADLVTVIDTNQLEPILDRAIDPVLGEYASTGPWLQSYLAAEKRRLHLRLAEWLALEATRHPFTVEACEDKLPNVHIGDLRLRLRADRIDRLADGSRLILDYKTGAASAASWQNERPDEPQLPLYAAYGNVENLSGVVFAKISAGKTGFDGRIRNAQTQLCSHIGAQTSMVKYPYTDAMRDEWASVLHNLAEEFLAGVARVDPREPKVCKQCGLHSLCRIAELTLSLSGENGDEDSDA
jgi:probable DNA repair protein